MMVHATQQIPVLLTLKEVCTALRLSEKTVLNLIDTRYIPAIKTGRQWRIRSDDLASALGDGKSLSPVRFDWRFADALRDRVGAGAIETVNARLWLTMKTPQARFSL
nr:helix-turn-helix domain-containing protein [uncultured Brevundimonas sp.]